MDEARVRDIVRDEMANMLIAALREVGPDLSALVADVPFVGAPLAGIIDGLTA